MVKYCHVRNNLTRIIGLMSGTSHDGVDAALVEIRPSAIRIDKPLTARQLTVEKGDPVIPVVKFIKHIHVHYPESLREEIRIAFTGTTEHICRLNFKLGEVFARTVLLLLKSTGLKPEDITAIASHGQTIYHIPPSGKKGGSTLQISEASVIAERTGIITISDFRTADMAAGGQGAPLVPLADYIIFKKSGRVRSILNIGGIANVTIIKEKMDDTIAFDTGPGNSLIDEVMRILFKGEKLYDKDGSFARSGRPVKGLLDELLTHPYFRKRPPKSTGRETFGIKMAEDILKRYSDTLPQDIIATLTELTSITVYNAIIKFRPDEVILTGGGSKNKFLAGLITDKFKKNKVAVNNISIYGIPPQAKEAVSFAILGYQTLNRRPGNITSATGARHKAILGKTIFMTKRKA
ncbi:MAG: anhydro-N-acetylmuramic acid kinase [Nitrospirae bacterium RIFCSPLOWO2_02_42_7]|nr:MAG: anhydro-N-acetylmuramic acid kinase [Nitrospirae bacterium RIFCSPLOWO2_02_42_7]OGW58933.1 MAG: anhydro-N-acetylmuramic acid kinase [Nitrospirae bacterium RIFCSPHIGHO2_02_FULL_42_12]